MRGCEDPKRHKTTHTHTHAYTRIHPHIHIHVHAHTFTHAQKHIHTQIRGAKLQYYQNKYRSWKNSCRSCRYPQYRKTIQPVRVVFFRCTIYSNKRSKWHPSNKSYFHSNLYFENHTYIKRKEQYCKQRCDILPEKKKQNKTE